MQRRLGHIVSTLVGHLWPAPYTMAGIAIGLLLQARFRRVDGIIEVHGPPVATALARLPVPAMAMTFGHVVFGRDDTTLMVTRAHERVHVRQYERWGLLFVPAYLVCSAVLYLRGRDAYRDNPFEEEAYRIDSRDL
jgi:hypothetical protein